MTNIYLEKIASFRDEEQRSAGGYIGGAAVGAAAGGLGMETLRRRVDKPLVAAKNLTDLAANSLAERRITNDSPDIVEGLRRAERASANIAKKLKMTRGMGTAGAIFGGLAGYGIADALRKKD